MRELRHPLLVLHSDPELQDLLRRSAGTQYEVVILEDWAAAHDAVRDSSPMAVMVVDPYHASTPGSPAAMLRRLLRDFPAATIIAALDTSADRVRDVRTLGDWGVAEVISCERELTSHALLQRLHLARERTLGQLLRPLMRVVRSARARRILLDVFGVVMAGGHARDLASAMGAAPRTLSRWCAAAALPPPRRLFGWMRILLAAHLLDEPGRTTTVVARLCGYSSDVALRTAVGSFTGMNPTQLRTQGAVRTTIQLFSAELRSWRSPAKA